MTDPAMQDRDPPAAAQAAQGASGQSGELRWGHSRGTPGGGVWCTAEFSPGPLRLQWGVGRQVLGAGPWDIGLEVDGVPVAPPAHWEEVCRELKEGVEYLEIEGRAANSIRVARHVVVARNDGFLLAADAILVSRAVALRYASVWPLGQGVSCDPAAPTRETRLTFGRRHATVLPLALPEWREDARGGELVPAGSGLVLRQWATSRALFAPLFIDLDPRRQGKPLTWRTLTVAENFRIQPPDQAVGYRVQIGSRQWLVYRSLGPKGNRSLLGHNLVSETLVARFSGGQVEPLVEIE